MNKYLKKALVIVGTAGVGALLSQVLGSWFPFMDTLPTTLGVIGAGAATGFFGYDEIIENLSKAKEKIIKVLKLDLEDNEYDYEYDDEEEYEDEYKTSEDYVEVKEDEVANIFSEAFYLEDDYYKDIIKFYRDAGSFKEAREIYCQSKGLEYSKPIKFSWNLEFLKDTLITVVDVCSDRIMEEANCDADVASIINSTAYNIVYNSGYYTIVNGMETVDEKNIINSIYHDENNYSFEERKEIVDRLCSISGVVNPLTQKHVVLSNGDENGRGKIIKFGN